jgi:hypothetical protein
MEVTTHCDGLCVVVVVENEVMYCDRERKGENIFDNAVTYRRHAHVYVALCTGCPNIAHNVL